MPGWAVVLGFAGLILGPTGGVWALVNWRSDRTGKEISQTGEIIAMFRGYIDEMEKALDRSQVELEAERKRANGHAQRADTAQTALEACQAECARMRTELDRWEAGGSAPAWGVPRE